MWGFGEAFCAPFAVFLKADDFTISLLTTLPILLGAIAQLAGAWAIEKLGHRRSLIAIVGMIQAIGYLPLFWIPYLFPAHGARIVVSLGTLLIVICNFSVPGWASIVGDMVPRRLRGRYFGRRTALAMLAMLLSMLASGRIVAASESHGNPWLGFGIVFSIAMVARAASAILLAKYVDPPFRADKTASFSFVQFMKTAGKTNFGRFTIAAALMNGAANLSGPYFTQYMLRDLHWTKDQYAVIQAALLLSQLTFLSWWGRLCDRHGNRSVILATGALMPVLPMFWCVTDSFPMLLAVQIFSGMVWSGFNLACSNFIFDSIDGTRRHRAFGYYNLINGMVSLVTGSIIGAWLAINLPTSFTLGGIQLAFISSLPALFIISGLLRGLIFILLLPMFKEVRTTAPITSREIFWRLCTGEPVFSSIAEWIAALPRPFGKSKPARG